MKHFSILFNSRLRRSFFFREPVSFTPLILPQMQPARRQALVLASATLRRASGAGTSTSSSTSGSGSNAAGGGSLFSFDRSDLRNQSFFARSFASRRPKVAVLLKEVRVNRESVCWWCSIASMGSVEVATRATVLLSLPPDLFFFV